jgi:NAD(P)-dependent dehydrogenase (short-subunit alcohol dehydrogenase family)
MSSPVVLITGALTGIGRAAAVAFAEAGNRVVVSGRRQNAGEALAGELRSLGAEAEFVQADVRNEDDVRRLVGRTVERFGRLDIAVNNAGTEGQVGPITDQTAESYAATFDTNVLGVILSMKHEVRVMQGQGSGSIINISSTYGHEGAAGASVYVGSKHAVEGITKSVALEAAKSGIRVNAVAPGPTDTGMLTRPLRARRRTRRLWSRLFLWVASTSRRSLPMRSSSSRRTKLHTSLAISSTPTAVRPLTDPILDAKVPFPIQKDTDHG